MKASEADSVRDRSEKTTRRRLTNAQDPEGSERIGFDPRMLVRGRGDAYFLAVIWAVRKAFFPTLLLGVIVAGLYFIVIDRDSADFIDQLNELTDSGNLLSALLSPFIIIVVALAGRLSVGFIALGGAVPLALAASPADQSGGIRLSRFIRTWWNRWKTAQAIRALRWTWPVRNEVLDRIDGRRTMWQWWDIVMIVLDIVLFIGMWVVLTIVTAQNNP